MRVADEFTPDEIGEAIGRPHPQVLAHEMRVEQATTPNLERALTFAGHMRFGRCLHNGTCGTWSAGRCETCTRVAAFVKAKLDGAPIVDTHIARIGEDGYPGSGAWCVHCTCGWSGTFNREYRHPHFFSYYADWPPKPKVYDTREQAEEVFARHLFDTGRGEQRAATLGIQPRADVDFVDGGRHPSCGSCDDAGCDVCACRCEGCGCWIECGDDDYAPHPPKCARCRPEVPKVEEREEPAPYDPDDIPW